MANENVEGTAKTAVANKEVKSKTRFVIVAEGQGGANIGMMLKASLPNNPFIIAINTSNQDLDQTGLPDDQWFKIGGENANGAGKNRDLAKTYWKNFFASVKGTDTNLNALQTFLGFYEEVLFHPTDQTFIISVFSSDGGTGSGIGPMFTTLLTNYINTTDGFSYNGKEYKIDDNAYTVPRPVVVGLTAKCSLDVGESNLQNAIESFLDIQNAIDKGIGNFFIADNALDPSVQYKSTDEMYKIINARIVTPLVKFLGIEMNSDVKCLDLQDKINTLRIPGCSSFTSVSEPNNYQYVIPYGQSVGRVVSMLKVDSEGVEERLAKELIDKFDITSIDKISAEFDISNAGLDGSVAKSLFEESMIGFFGWRNLGVVVEDLRERKRRIGDTNIKKATTVAQSARGFNTVKEDGENLKNKLSMQSMETNDLMDLF